MAVALARFDAQREERQSRLKGLRDRLERALQKDCGPIVINGLRARRLPNTSSIAFPGLNGEALLVALDLAGIACSLGSTCASGAMEPAPALAAMGLPPEIASSSVRFSLGMENSPDEIDEAARRIAQCVNRLRTAPNASARDQAQSVQPLVGRGR